MSRVDPHWIRGTVDELALEQGCYFDENAALRPCRFLETFCCQSKGRRFAGKPLALMPSQRDFLMRLHGWKREDGTRRYRRFYLEEPKKNGKSTFFSGECLYLTVGDGEPGAEVYVCAVDKDQTKAVFGEACNMVEQSPSLAKRLEIIPSAFTMVDAKTRSRMEGLSADVESKDGKNAYAVLFDELHRQRGSAMWDIMRYAGAGRDQPLIGSITTAGSNRLSVCWQQHDYTKKVNAGLIPDTSHLGVIYGAEPTDDIEDPATWWKANPGMGIIVSEQDFRDELKAALANPSELANFLRLRLGIWSQSDVRFLPSDKWDACGKISFQEPSLRGAGCFSGLDLAATIDIAALAHVFQADDEATKVIWRFWIPEETAERRQKRDEVPYLTWAKQGLITLTPGNVIDYAYIKTQIMKDAQFFGMKRLYSDPWNATQLLGELQEEGLDVQTFNQVPKYQNEPTKYLGRLVMQGKFHHGNNAVANWMADNAVAKRDSNGNIKLDKEKSKEKIDGLVAVVNALAARIAPDPDGGGESIYNKQRIFFVG
jgi:phage terminase large subunit-like protein